MADKKVTENDKGEDTKYCWNLGKGKCAMCKVITLLWLDYNICCNCTKKAVTKGLIYVDVTV